MKKSLFMKSISILLVVTLITSTITFCLGGCSVKFKPKMADIDTPTYSDTRLEISSQNVSKNYSELTNALKSNNNEEIKEKADALKKSVNNALSEFKTYSEEISSKINDSDNVIKSRAEEFSRYFSENSQKALDAINDIILNSKNTDSPSYQQSIDTLEKYFEVEKEIMITSDNLENSISKKSDAEKLSVNNIDNYVKNSVSAVGSSPFNENSLRTEDETDLSDEIKALADQLKTPLQVYLYLKNHINYEAYSGSRKGAVATFDSNGGNDVDQASLLIAMLRYLNYPAKYVNGTIFISADQALKLTSAKDLNTAGTILASSGKKVFSIVSGGRIEGFQMDQTWVEAYVPYTDYRGAGNAAGDYRWIPLDTSIKGYNQVETIYDDIEKYGISESDYVNGMSSSQLNALYEKLSAYEKEHEGEEAYLISRQIISESTAYLPLSLQYVVKSIDGEYDKIKERDSDTITFTIDGQNIAKLKPYEMYGKRLIVEYVPATDSDAETIKSFGSVFNTPSYLVKVRAALKLDDQIIGQACEVTLGQSQTFNMNVYSQGSSTYVTNNLTAGSMYQITQDMQMISSKELTKAFDEAEGISAGVNIDNIYSSEKLGRILDMAGKLYYAQVDIADNILAERHNISITRSLSVGMTGYQVRSETMWGMPVGIAEGNLYIDIDLNNVAAISRDGDKDSEFKYITASGVMSSAYEGTVWSEFTGEPGVSTISILEEAEEEGQSILMLSKKNFEEQKANLHLDRTTMNAVQQAVNAGKIVTVHTDMITYGEWEGFGYIVTTPETGGAAYMISGGLNGGSSDGLVSLAYMVDIGFSIVDIVEAFQMIPTMLGLFTMGGPFGIIVGTLVAAVIVTMVVFAIMDYFNSIQLMCRYVNGDEEAGKELEINAVINVSVAAGGAIVGKVAKAGLARVAKKKIATQLGEELAEKLVKNSDSPGDIVKSLKKLNKNGVAKETIEEIAETYGEKGLKAARRGDNALEAVLKHGDNAVNLINNYGDDAVRAITKNGDQAIDLMNKHGKNAVKSIANHGDDAVKLITKHGDNAAKSIANYGDDAVKLITKYGDDAAKAIADNGKKAVKLITDYGDNAAKSIANHGDDAVKLITKHGDDAAKAIANHGDDAVRLITKHGDDAATAIANHGDKTIIVIDNYADNGLKAIKNGIEPDDIITIADDWKISPSDFDKLGITDSKAAKEVASRGYNKQIVNLEFTGSTSGSISDKFINDNATKYNKYFQLKATGKSHNEINKALLDDMLDHATKWEKNIQVPFTEADKKSVRDAVSSAYKETSSLDNVSEELFYDLKNGLIEYNPEQQFPNAYNVWKQKFLTGDDVACFVNGETHTNIMANWNALGRDAEGVTQTSLFVLNDVDARAVLAQTGTDPKLLAKKLGLSDDTFDTGAYLIHIDRSCVENIRTSAIDTLGSNEWWTPGMRTSGGQYEAVINKLYNVTTNPNVNLNDCIIPKK